MSREDKTGERNYCSGFLDLDWVGFRNKANMAYSLLCGRKFQQLKSKVMYFEETRS